MSEILFSQQEFSLIKEMLEGTDLYSAYQPLTEYEEVDHPKINNNISFPETKPPLQQPQLQPQPPPKIAPPAFLYDASALNQRYEQEQRVAHQVPKKKEEMSYVDKLFSKKRELIKLLQFVFIIVLALSLHALIEHYLKDYISDHDMSSWRQFFLRLLYPLSILFILWNLKAFTK